MVCKLYTCKICLLGRIGERGMGLLWDIFKGNLSMGEISICFGELDKIWKVFKSCIEEEIELKGISLRKIGLCSSRKNGSGLWEISISYYRDEYDCTYKATYNLSNSLYTVTDGDDLSEEFRKKIKGYLFNAVKSIYLLNSEITDIIMKERNTSNTIMVISSVKNRLILLYEGSCSAINEVKSVVKKNITDIDDYFYDNIVSL